MKDHNQILAELIYDEIYPKYRRKEKIDRMGNIDQIKQVLDEQPPIDYKKLAKEIDNRYQRFSDKSTIGDRTNSISGLLTQHFADQGKTPDELQEIAEAAFPELRSQPKAPEGLEEITPFNFIQQLPPVLYSDIKEQVSRSNMKEDIYWLMDRYATKVIAQKLPSEWISVEERLPNCGVPVLLYCGHPDHVGFKTRTGELGEFVDMGVGFHFHGFEPAYKPTHWQPLPEPPNSSQIK